MKSECPGWYSNKQKKVVYLTANDSACKARSKAARALLTKKRRALYMPKNKRGRKTSTAATLEKDISAALRVGAETPVPAPPPAGIPAVKPVIQVQQGHTPQSNAPIPGTQSIADHSFAARQNYYGNAAAYATGLFRPAATSQSVQGFHPGHPYQAPQ